MKTSKPFSTISYNSESFLKIKLEELVSRRAISFYAFVYHYAEVDETKNHTHLLIIPNGQIQTDSVTDLLTELDPTNPLKPLGVMPWRSSKFGDWFLYSCHDTAYLASKNQTRKHHYQESDFKCSNNDYLHELVTTIDRSKYAKTKDIVDAIKNGKSFIEMVESGQIPAPQFNQWYQLYNFVKSSNRVFRNNRISHSHKLVPEIDPMTGEVLYRPLEDSQASTDELRSCESSGEAASFENDSK